MILDIVYYPNEILEKPCEKVTEFNEELGKLLDDMAETMKSANGMGISANQVGVSKMIFIMLDKSGNIVEFVNPVITEFSEDKASLREGCLSSPNVYEFVPTRSQDVTVTAQDRNGKDFTVVASGIEAVCVQHEYDHLNGVFWFERLPSRQIKRAANKRWKKARTRLGV